MPMQDYVHGTVSVSTTATEIVVGNEENDGLLVSNRGDVTVYLGGSGVTADDTSTGGVDVQPGEKVVLSTVGNDQAVLYGVTTAGTAIVSYIITPTI